jgi:hypothetical protein
VKLSSYPFFNSSFGMQNKRETSKLEKEVLPVFDVEF